MIARLEKPPFVSAHCLVGSAIRIFPVREPIATGGHGPVKLSIEHHCAPRMVVRPRWLEEADFWPMDRGLIPYAGIAAAPPFTCPKPAAQPIIPRRPATAP
jgi:hypothetical protein